MKTKVLAKAQSTLEYAVLIAVIVAVLLAMQIYMKRASEGKLKESADRIGDQFEIGKTESVETTTTSGTTTQVVSSGVTTSNTEGEQITQTSSENVEGYGNTN